MKKNTNKRLLILDTIIIGFSFFISLFLRFDGRIPSIYINAYYSYIPLIIILKIFIFYIFSLYQIYWFSSSIKEAFTIVYAVLVSNLPIAIYIYFNRVFPLSVVPISFLIDIFLVGIVRFIYRYSNYNYKIKKFLKSSPSSRLDNKKESDKNLMIVGAGEAGILIIDELRRHSNLGNPVVLIDDDLQKHGSFVKGILVAGGTQDISKIVEEYEVDEIMLALPSIDSRKKADILEICTATGKKVKTLPGIYELIGNDVSINQIRDVKIEDLLGREEVVLNQNLLEVMVKDKVILVTGGGGSIGSELSRQLANYSPKQLIILDIYENNAYDIQMELRKRHPDLNLLVLIESIRDRASIDRIFDKYRPAIVFHAAAHKHVPLMEDSYLSAIKNNVFGSKNVFEAADKYGAEKLVNISTDKAVNPTNIMGASKRIIELLLQTINKNSNTDFVAVRFGNVLGSNGSVIPLFKRQIEEGGPVTVTHKDIIRYFMTIPEACQLVLQAGSIAKGGEIFILDMGEPVRIVDLAEKLIKLSGYVPYEDIDIKFTGLRPGEKLYEELLLDLDKSSQTQFNKIYIEKPMEINENVFESQIRKMEKVLDYASKEEIIELLEEIIPSFNHKENK